MIKAYLILLFILIGSQLTAQVYFWTETDILDKVWKKQRKALKIKTIYKYETNYLWTVKNKNKYSEVLYFNKNGQKTAHKTLVRDKSTNKKQHELIDSFTYTSKGVFKEFKRYLVNKKSTSLVLRDVASHNKNGDIDTITHYKNGIANSYDVYTYDEMGRANSMEEYYLWNGKKASSYTFKYNENNLLIEYTVIRYIGRSSSKSKTQINYNTNGQPLSFTYYDRSDKKTGIQYYTWDNKGRLENIDNSKQTETSYFYNSDSFLLPKHTHRKSPKGFGGGYNNTYTACKFKFYK